MEEKKYTAILKCDCDSYNFTYSEIENGFYCTECLRFIHEEEAGKHLELVEDIDSLMDLIEDIEERICNECGKEMQEGYCINGGEEYYCSDECLHKHISPEEWEEMYEDGGDSYWTEWEV